MEPSNFQTLMETLFAHMERQDARAAVTNEALLDLVGEVRTMKQDGQKFQQQQGQFNLRMLEWIDKQEGFNERQEKFNERQEKFNERQDQFNIIFLDEIRDIKHDVRDLKKDIGILKDITLKQHDERLKRLEDFMDGLMRKAG